MNAALAAVLAVSGLAAAPAGADECTCPAARITNGWCRPCEVGYVASVEVRSAILYETLDAHGHDIDPNSIECESCQSALKVDGFCERCRWGFVSTKLYFSRLTYHLARGEVKDVSKLTCRTCAKNAGRTKLPLEDQGWCARCKIGMVGNTAFKDRKEFERASKELKRLLLAIRAAERCEYCGPALFMDTTCVTCGTTYKDGKKVAAKRPESAAPAHPHPH
ncbi:MAG: hypothetical protein ACYSU7_05325 [Planctomycetota bacterium]|jgi:hypothetical protein